MDGESRAAIHATAPAAGRPTAPDSATAPATRRPVFEVEGLCVEYETEAGVLRAVRDVSLSVHEHESFGLVGESGSGKSTLAMGAIRYLARNGRITAGSVRLNGVELLGLSPKELRGLWGSSIGVVYQSPLSALNPSIQIGKQLAEVARLHLGMDRAAARARVTEMLSKVAMPDPEAVMKRYPHQLSGGMLQRCVIAMALMTNPALLIMDEPTTALDVTTQAVVLDLVADLKREFDSAILYITHDLGVVTKICERIGVMYAGEFMEQASLRALFQRPLHPYTLDLLGCVPRFETTPVRRSLVTIPGSIPRLDELPTGCVFAPRCSLVQDACRAERPPLVEIEDGHRTACRRWRDVPTPTEYLCEATEALSPMESSDEAAVALVEVDDTYTHFRGPGSGLIPGRRRYRAIRAVDGVSFTVDEGRTLGIVGESGSGKTTVARAIIGLTPATGGDIRLRGEKLERSTGRRRRDVLKEIQMVFQNPDASLNPTRSVGDAITRPLVLLGGLGGKDAREQAEGLLRAVSLPAGYFDRLPNELSGGEKQRVAIARAFAADPDLILCDEPISSLDVSVQGALMNLLMTLQQEKRTSYVFISHDLSAVQHLSDTIAVMYLGRVMEMGDSVRVLTPPFHPYTEALLSAVPVADPDVTQTPIRLGGTVPSAMDVPAGCRFHPRCPRRLGDICCTEEPPWRHGEGEHRIYCHIPLEELAHLQEKTLVLAAGEEPALREKDV
ncbi:MAG TPA: dipeptide ABC transporter ATP-binding protein [Thermoleophilia bacterium]|nr:dipeptide ABC transporter ATP-binding protein [Thermoleophilia bacterium]